jgi:hypothetical protein
MISTMKTAHRAGLNYRLIRFESRSEEPLDPANAQSHREADPEFEGSLEVEMLRAANRFMMGIVTGTDIPLLSEPEVSEQSSWLQ